MSLFARQHPDVIGAPLEDFHWSFIETQTSSVIVEILKTFFNQNSSYFSVVFPSIESFQNSEDKKKLFVSKVFSYTTRKFPMIAVVVMQHQEKPVYIGSDNLVYIDKYIGVDGLLYGQEVFGGKDNLQVTLLIATLSPEERRKLIDAVRFCFIHFFKTTFIYQDDDKSFFAISPTMEPIRVGSEKEIADEQGLQYICTNTIELSVLVEYRFKDYSKTFVQLSSIDISGETKIK